MKYLIFYINSMYKPAFGLLCAGLGISAALFITLALSLHNELLSGSRDLFYRVGEAVEAISFPLLLAMTVSFAVDLNERSRNR